MKQDNRLWKNPNCNIREFQLVTNLLYEKKAPIEWFFPPIGKVATFALRNHKAKIICPARRLPRSSLNSSLIQQGPAIAMRAGLPRPAT